MKAQAGRQTNPRRRGHRLKRLAYELGALAEDAARDGFASAANGLRQAAQSAAYAGEAYLKGAQE